jgi:tRNA(Leu) C34 or U34 (ribose-2'-O)-methylase TrmL
MNSAFMKSDILKFGDRHGNANALHGAAGSAATIARTMAADYSSAPAMSKGFCCIGLFNPKSPENVGSVLRAAGCYGVNSVFYTGVRYDRAKEFVTDTKKVHQKIPLIGIEDLQQVIPLGCTPVAVELVKGAKPLPEYTHPERAFYIFGPEDGTLDKTIRAWCADVVYIPTVGCMNLAATVNVVLYDRLAKAHRKSSPAD